MTATPRTRTLPLAFYDRPTLEVAHDLIGKVLVHDTPDGTAAGVIVETEAYIGEDDPACHASCGPTPRNAPLYGPAGHAYVYFNYGVHWLVNAVTGGAGDPAAVLVRALAPLDGLTLMRERRVARRRAGGTVADAALCRGPGNLTVALGITGAQNRLPLDGPLRIEDRRLPALHVAWGPRIGIRVGLDRPWRAYVPGHPAVSVSR